MKYLRIPVKMKIDEMEEAVYKVIEANDPLFGDDDDEIGDCMLPNETKSGIWKITCKKVSSGIELHAFDITGDSKTYWCPETAKELAAKIDLDPNWINGTFPIEQNERNEIIASVREHFSE